MVCSEDDGEFYTFLKICHTALVGKDNGHRYEFGFIRTAVILNILIYFQVNCYYHIRIFNTS